MPNNWYVVRPSHSMACNANYVAIELSTDLKSSLLKLLLGKKALVKALGHGMGDSGRLSIRVAFYGAWWLKELPPEWEQMSVDYTLDDWELVRETPIVALAHSQDQLPDDFHSKILAPLETDDGEEQGLNSLGDDDEAWLYFDLMVDTGSGTHTVETPPLSKEIIKWLMSSIKKEKENG